MSVNMQCPICGKTIKASDSSVGKTEKCPQCGELIKIRGQKSNYLKDTTNPTNLSSNENVPRHIPKKQLSDSEIPIRIKELLYENEEILYASRPSRSSLTIKMIFAGLLWGIIGLGFFLFGILIILPVALLITYLIWKNQYYVITQHRTIISRGIFNIAIKIMPNHNIQLISINTGLIDRFLNLNTVVLSSAAMGGSIFGAFPGMDSGNIKLMHVIVADVIPHYSGVSKGTKAVG